MSAITGYRTLSESEVLLINEIKRVGEEVRGLIAKLRPNGPEAWVGDPDQRWVSIGATRLQEGFMALTRSVAKPTSFA
jgi:hypothetical protein